MIWWFTWELSSYTGTWPGLVVSFRSPWNMNFLRALPSAALRGGTTKNDEQGVQAPAYACVWPTLHFNEWIISICLWKLGCTTVRIPLLDSGVQHAIGNNGLLTPTGIGFPWVDKPRLPYSWCVAVLAVVHQSSIIVRDSIPSQGGKRGRLASHSCSIFSL